MPSDSSFQRLDNVLKDDRVPLKQSVQRLFSNTPKLATKCPRKNLYHVEYKFLKSRTLIGCVTAVVRGEVIACLTAYGRKWIPIVRVDGFRQNDTS